MTKISFLTKQEYQKMHLNLKIILHKVLKITYFLGEMIRRTNKIKTKEMR